MIVLNCGKNLNYYRIHPQVIARNSPNKYIPFNQINTPIPAKNILLNLVVQFLKIAPA